MIGTVLIFIAGFLISMFFSGVEMAFVSCNKLRVRHLAEEGNRRAKIINNLLGRPKRVLASVLIYTNLGNVALSAAFAYMLEERFQIVEPWISTLILTPVLVVFAEMVPKEYCRLHANELVFSVAVVLRWSTRLVAKIVESIIGLTDYILQLVEPSEQKKSPFVTRNELRALFHESARKGIVLDYEKRLIDKIFEFEKRPVDEIMQPLTAVNKISYQGSIKQLKAMARKANRNAFWALTFDGRHNNIVGVIHVFDILFEDDEGESIQPFIRTPLFIRGHTSNEEAFELLQKKRQTIAIVLDRQDRAIGVVTVQGLIQL